MERDITPLHRYYTQAGHKGAIHGHGFHYSHLRGAEIEMGSNSFIESQSNLSIWEKGFGYKRHEYVAALASGVSAYRCTEGTAQLDITCSLLDQV